MQTKENKKIMILSAPIGSGHVQSANAIKKELENYPDINVITGSVFDFAPSFFCKSLLNTYLNLLRVFPYGYELLYRWADKSNSLTLRYIVNNIFAFGAYNYIKKYKPDLVITTHVTPAGILALYKKKYNKNIPLFGIVTDFSMHKWWLYDEIDAYVVVDKKIFLEYEKSLNVNQELWDYGIPIDNSFYIFNKTKNELREELGLPKDHFICLLSGGGEGLLPMDDILTKWQEISSENDKISFVAICGKNKRLQNKLRSMNVNNVYVLGFVDNIFLYMQSSDIIISKAGGVTASEALATELPMLVYKPLPGQEQSNIRYLSQKEVAKEVFNINDLFENILYLKSNPNIILDIKEKQRAIKKHNTAKNVVDKIFEYMKW